MWQKEDEEDARKKALKDEELARFKIIYADVIADVQHIRDTKEWLDLTASSKDEPPMVLPRLTEVSPPRE